jgi:hypothetical protein
MASRAEPPGRIARLPPAGSEAKDGGQLDGNVGPGVTSGYPRPATRRLYGGALLELSRFSGRVNSEVMNGSQPSGAKSFSRLAGE